MRCYQLVITLVALILSACSKEESKYVEPATHECEKKAINNQFIVAHPDGSFSLSHKEPTLNEEVLWYEPNYAIEIEPKSQIRSEFITREQDNYEKWYDVGIDHYWRQGFMGQGVIVAVVDTGVETNSPFLRGRFALSPAEPIESEEENPLTDPSVLPEESGEEGVVESEEEVIESEEEQAERVEHMGWNFLTNNQDQSDESYHGTVIAHFIAGSPQTPGGPGLAPAATILPVDFMDDSGGDEFLAIKAVDYSIEKGAKIINSSWSTPCSRYLKARYPDWEEQGVLLVHAAGNDGISLEDRPLSSSNYDGEGFLSIGSIDEFFNRADFSNFGNAVRLYTFGSDLITVDKGFFSGGEPNLVKVAGTSYSAAIISGVAAVIWSAHPEWTNKQMKKFLLENIEHRDRLRIPVLRLNELDVTSGGGSS